MFVETHTRVMAHAYNTMLYSCTIVHDVFSCRVFAATMNAADTAQLLTAVRPAAAACTAYSCTVVIVIKLIYLYGLCDAAPPLYCSLSHTTPLLVPWYVKVSLSGQYTVAVPHRYSSPP